MANTISIVFQSGIRDHLRAREGAWGAKKSEILLGARPFRGFSTISTILKSTLKLTGS